MTTLPPQAESLRIRVISVDELKQQYEAERINSTDGSSQPMEITDTLDRLYRQEQAQGPNLHQLMLPSVNQLSSDVFHSSLLVIIEALRLLRYQGYQYYTHNLNTPISLGLHTIQPDLAPIQIGNDSPFQKLAKPIQSWLGKQMKRASRHAS